LFVCLSVGFALNHKIVGVVYTGGQTFDVNASVETAGLESIYR